MARGLSTRTRSADNCLRAQSKNALSIAVPIPISVCLAYAIPNSPTWAMPELPTSSKRGLPQLHGQAGQSGEDGVGLVPDSLQELLLPLQGNPKFAGTEGEVI